MTQIWKDNNKYITVKKKIDKEQKRNFGSREYSFDFNKI